ncbi:MAG: Mur ligase domain-containing protein, partial [Candidatus Neomarinimicrobiota bacterium]
MKLDLLLKNIAQDEITLPNINIEKVCTNSSEVTNESLFIAINGTKNDGHSFIQEAITNGASAIVSNGKNLEELGVPNVPVTNTRLAASRISAQFYNHPSKKMK